MQIYKFYIYRHIRPDNNQVFYIGMGRHQPKGNYHARAKTSHSRNKYWNRIVKLNPNYKIEIIFDNLTETEAKDKEREFIKLYGRSDLQEGSLCNLTDGGEGNYNMSVETRRKISESKKGKRNPNFGKSRSEESLEKFITKMRGPLNPNFGKKIPDWHKEINRRAQLGRKHSSETIAKIIGKVSKKVINVETNEIFNSVGEVAIRYGKSNSQMGRLIKKNAFNLKFA